MLMVSLRASPTLLEWECHFLVHLLTGFFQLKPGLLRELHSDQRCSRPTPHWGGAYFIWVDGHLCVCVGAFGEETFTTGDSLFHTYWPVRKPGCWSVKVIILFILHTHLNAQHILVFLNSNKLCKLNFSVHRDLYPQRSYEKINRPQEAAAKWEKVACSPLSLCMNVFSFFKIKPERGCCLCLFWKTVLLLVCAHGVSWLDVNPTPQKHLACVAN